MFCVVLKPNVMPSEFCRIQDNDLCGVSFSDGGGGGE